MLESVSLCNMHVGCFRHLHTVLEDMSRGQSQLFTLLYSFTLSTPFLVSVVYLI